MFIDCFYSSSCLRSHGYKCNELSLPCCSWSSFRFHGNGCRQHGVWKWFWMSRWEKLLSLSRSPLVAVNKPPEHVTPPTSPPPRRTGNQWMTGMVEEDCSLLLQTFRVCLAPVIQRIDAPVLLTVSLFGSGSRWGIGSGFWVSDEPNQFRIIQNHQYLWV